MKDDGWLKNPLSLKGKRIYVAGHTGLVGSAVVRRLEQEDCEILTIPRAELDLRDQTETHQWIKHHAPDIIILAAAKVGGIYPNKTYPADFISDNLAIQNNVITAAHTYGVEKLLFLGSSCIYPRDAQNPITEDALLSGALEPTNDTYAIAKIAGTKQCEAYRRQYNCDFITAMPCNIYGPEDFRAGFDPQNAHVIAALIDRAHKAKEDGAESLKIWGTGKPRREFMYSDGLADALIFLLQNYSHHKPVNIGAGEDISIADLAQIICDVVGFTCDLIFDATMPDGVMRKLMDSSRITNQGWRPQTDLKQGIRKTYERYL